MESDWNRGDRWKGRSLWTTVRRTPDGKKWWEKKSGEWIYLLPLFSLMPRVRCALLGRPLLIIAQGVIILMLAGQVVDWLQHKVLFCLGEVMNASQPFPPFTRPLPCLAIHCGISDG